MNVRLVLAAIIALPRFAPVAKSLSDPSTSFAMLSDPDARGRAFVRGSRGISRIGRCRGTATPCRGTRAA